MKTYNEIKEKVKSMLSEERFHHSECVEKRCVEYAKQYGVDEEKARLVGIAHDIAKEMPFEEKIKYAEENGIDLKEIEIKNPALLHSIIGAKMCEKEFGFTKDMVEAVANHTTGKPGMDMLSKVLFIGDSTGEDRDYDDAKFIYEIVKKDIDEAIFEYQNKTIIKIIQEGKLLHPNTVDVRNEYLMKK